MNPIPTQRVCIVTGIDISEQGNGSKFLSTNSVLKIYYSNKDLFAELQNKYGSNKDGLKPEELSYYISHNIRNSDSNPRNNYNKKIREYEEQTFLFDITPYIKELAV